MKNKIKSTAPLGSGFLVAVCRSPPVSRVSSQPVSGTVHTTDILCKREKYYEQKDKTKKGENIHEKNIYINTRKNKGKNITYGKIKER